MYSLIYIAAVISLATAQSNLTCDSTRFRACTVNLASRLGDPVDPYNIWVDPITFRDNLNTIFGKGDVTNYVRVCNSMQMFYACLGPYIYSCLGVLGLTAQNMDPYMAYAYEGLMNLWRFQCGAGFFGVESTGSFSCIQSTVARYQDQLKPLLASYRSNVEHHPADACTYANQLSRGYQAVFTAGPCRSEGLSQFAGWYGCEGQNEYTIAQFPECGPINECPYESTNDTEKYVKFVNDKLLVKIGPTWTKKKNGEWYLEPEKWI